MAVGTEATISVDPGSGSETESEDGNFDDTQVAQTYESFAQSQLVHPAASDIPNCPSIEKVVGELLALDARDVLDHPEETHNLIIQASNAITAFLDVLLDSRIVLMDEFRAHLINGLASLLRYDFMEKLFVFRILFHQIAASEMPQGHSSVIVCWVDVVLAKLSHAILAVMGNFCETKVASLETLSRHREEMTLRAVLQFPHEWRNVPKLLQTPNVSPAALRAAIHLVYGVYVLGPQLGTSSPWITESSPNEILTILRQHITNHYTQLDPAEEVQCNAETRTMFSMTIALFAEAELNETRGSPTFRPHTQAILLALIRRVLQPVDSLGSSVVITPSLTVDSPQTIILRFSSVVPWSWRVWNDNRVLDSEIIDHLTCAWLFDASKPDLRDEQYSWQESTYTTVHGDPSAAISSFARAFRHFSACLKSNEILSTENLCILHRLCWITTQLLQIPESTQTSFGPIIEDICQSICYVFILLEDPKKDLYVKNLALEYLTLVTSEIVRPVLTKCTQDPKLFAKLDEKLTSLTRKIRTRSLSDAELVVIRQMLHFLTIAWNCDVTKLAYRQTTTAFLAALLDLLITHPADKYEDALTDALVTALALVERLRRRPDFKDINKLWDDDSIWTLCLRHESSNLSVASAFSTYIEACGGNRQCQSLTVLDAWDHIRDAMMLIVHHEFLEDDEAIALLIIPSISSALENIFIHLGETLREFIDASPWTSNLSDSLHELARHPSDDEYTSILQSRLTLDVPQLLRKASNKPKASRPNVEEAGEESTNLLFYQSEGSRCYLFLTKLTSKTEAT